MNTVTSSVLNSLFSQRLDSYEGKEKIAETGAAYIRDRLRETSFARKILPPEQVTKGDCQRSVSHDGLVKIIDIEPESYAMAINFRSQPDGRYVSASRYEIPFFPISSELFSKSEQELMAYEMPITKIIEQNSVKDIQKIEDTVFLDYVLAAIKASHSAAKPKNVVDATKATVTDKADIIKLFNMLVNDELPVGVMLMTDSMLNNIMALDTVQLGEILGSEVFRDGYKYNTLMGRKLITTIKTDIVLPTEIFCFTEPDFFGKFFVLDNTKFYIDKRANMIEWRSWETIAIGLGNIRGADRIVFTNGGADPRALI